MTVSTLYATVTQLRAQFNITDTDRDALLTNALAAASRYIDRQTGRRFWLDDTTSARVFNPRYRIECTSEGEKFTVDDIGDTTGMVVEVGSGSTWTTITDYETGPDNAIAIGEPVWRLLRPLLPWVCWPQQRIRVTARWGWPAIPDDIMQATLIQAARLYKRKDSPEGVMGSAEWGLIRLSRVDPDVQALITDYTLPGVG